MEFEGIFIFCALLCYVSASQWSTWSTDSDRAVGPGGAGGPIIPPDAMENSRNKIIKPDKQASEIINDMKKTTNNAIMITGGYGGGFPGSPWHPKDDFLNLEVSTARFDCKFPELPKIVPDGFRFAEPNIFLNYNADGDIISCGGANRHHSRLCYKLNTKTKSWSFHSSLIQMRFNGAAVSMPNGLYIFGGGYSAQLSNTFEFLPRGSNVWKLGSTQIPKGFTNGCVVRISDNELILIGGKGMGGKSTKFDNRFKPDNTTMNRVLHFNTKTQEFKTWPELKQGRYYHSCALIGENIIVVGGFKTGIMYGRALPSTEIIPLSTRIPIAGGNLNHDRSWFGLLNIGKSDGASEKLVAFGGYGTHGYLQSMEEWNESTKQWTLMPNVLNDKRRSFGYLAVDSKLTCSNER